DWSSDVCSSDLKREAVSNSCAHSFQLPPPVRAVANDAPDIIVVDDVRVRWRNRQRPSGQRGRIVGEGCPDVLTVGRVPVEPPDAAELRNDEDPSRIRLIDCHIDRYSTDMVGPTVLLSEKQLVDSCE